jgi:hypothetical protein
MQECSGHVVLEVFRVLTQPERCLVFLGLIFSHKSNRILVWFGGFETSFACRDRSVVQRSTQLVSTAEMSETHAAVSSGDSAAPVRTIGEEELFFWAQVEPCFRHFPSISVEHGLDLAPSQAKLTRKRAFTEITGT